MSGTQSDIPAAPARDSFGISNILAQREGALPPNLLQEDRPEAKPETKPDTPQSDAEGVADQLRRDAEAARARAVAAEQRAAQETRRAQEATAEVQRTRQSAYETEYNSVSTALADREAEADRLKAEMRVQAEAGDHARMAEISLRLGEVGAEMVTLRSGKQAFEAERAAKLRQPEPAPAAPASPDAEKERFLASRTPKTAEWLRNNDRFFTDQNFRNIVVGADAIAQGRHIPPDSDEYFRFIEEQAGMTTARPQQSGSSAPPAAPPSRDAPGPTGRNNRGGDIHISPEDRRIATWMGVDPEDYVREKQHLYSIGELPHRRR
jgi:hypothetical protein